MNILAIETISKRGSLAVVSGSTILGEKVVDNSLNHAANLVLSIDMLLKDISMTISDIMAIAVDIGPGSFTGIRVGIACAKGLSQLNKIKVIGICSLEVLCWTLNTRNCPKDSNNNLVPFIDAKRGKIYSGKYQLHDESLKEIHHPFLTTIEELNANISSDDFVFGPDINMLYQDNDPIYPMAGMLGLIAGKMLQNKTRKTSVEPMYIHDVIYRKQSNSQR